MGDVIAGDNGVEKALEQAHSRKGLGDLGPRAAGGNSQRQACGGPTAQGARRVGWLADRWQRGAASGGRAGPSTGSNAQPNRAPPSKASRSTPCGLPATAGPRCPHPWPWLHAQSPSRSPQAWCRLQVGGVARLFGRPVKARTGRRQHSRRSAGHGEGSGSPGAYAATRGCAAHARAVAHCLLALPAHAPAHPFCSTQPLPAHVPAHPCLPLPAPAPHPPATSRYSSVLRCVAPGMSMITPCTHTGPPLHERAHGSGAPTLHLPRPWLRGPQPN